MRSPGKWVIGHKKAGLTAGRLGPGEAAAPEGLKPRRVLQTGTHLMPLFPDWWGAGKWVLPTKQDPRPEPESVRG